MEAGRILHSLHLSGGLGDGIKRPVPAGSVLAQDDAEMADMDWAEQPYAVLANPDRWVGQQAAYALVDCIHWPGLRYRRDIGYRAIAREQPA